MTQHTVGVQNIAPTASGSSSSATSEAGRRVTRPPSQTCRAPCDSWPCSTLPARLSHYPNAAEQTLADGRGTTARSARSLVNNMKAWFGDGRRRHDFGYGWLPRRGKKDYTVFGMIESALRGEMSCSTSWARTPWSRTEDLKHDLRRAHKLEMLVVQTCGKPRPSFRNHRRRSKTIATEVVLLPPPTSWEKTCTITGSASVAGGIEAIEPPARRERSLDPRRALQAGSANRYRTRPTRRSRSSSRAVLN